MAFPSTWEGTIFLFVDDSIQSKTKKLYHPIAGASVLALRLISPIFLIRKQFFLPEMINIRQAELVLRHGMIQNIHPGRL
jgi:hypothetical protein